MDIDENAVGNRSQQDVTRTTDNETGHDPRNDAPEVSLPPNDEAPVTEDMRQAEVNNPVSSDDSDAAPHMNEQDEHDKEARGLPASDPESGA